MHARTADVQPAAPWSADSHREVQPDEQEAQGLAGWTRDKVGSVVESVKEKIGIGERLVRRRLRLV